MFNFFAGCVVSAIFMLFFVIIPHTQPNSVWQGVVIEKGYGLYCPKSGEFAFVGECGGYN